MNVEPDVNSIKAAREWFYKTKRCITPHVYGGLKVPQLNK